MPFLFIKFLVGMFAPVIVKIIEVIVTSSKHW